MSGDISSREAIRDYLRDLPEEGRRREIFSRVGRLALFNLPEHLSKIDQYSGGETEYFGATCLFAATALVQISKERPGLRIDHDAVYSLMQAANEIGVGTNPFANVAATTSEYNYSDLYEPASYAFVNFGYLDESKSGLSAILLTGSSVEQNFFSTLTDATDWRTPSDMLLSGDRSWGIWDLWFERLFAGRNWHSEAMLEVLKTFTQKEDWQGDPVHINSKFDPVLELYLAEDAKSGEVIKVNAEGKLYAEAVTKLPQDILSEAKDRILDAITDIRLEIQKPQSRFACLADVCTVLEAWVQSYGDRPLRLHEKLADAMDMTAEAAAYNGLLEDAVVKVFLRELERSRSDLRANDAVIEERIRRRVRVRYDEMDEPKKQLFIDFVSASADASEPKLQSEIREDIPLIKNEETPNEQKERALVREAERTTQVRQLSVEGLVNKAKDVNTLAKTGQHAADLWELVKGLFI